MKSEMEEHNNHLHLIVQYYRCATPERQAEIDTCLRNNLLNPYLAAIHLLTEEQFDLSGFPNQEKIRQTIIGERLTYARAFRYANDWPESAIWMLSNADIYFDDTLSFLPEVDFTNQIFALTRHDLLEDGSIELVPLDIANASQDAWVFASPICLKNVYTDFKLGIPGCDNRIAYEFVAHSDLIVSNPSLKIKIYHLDRAINQNVIDKSVGYASLQANKDSTKYIPPPYQRSLYPDDMMTATSKYYYRNYINALDTMDIIRNYYIRQLGRSNNEVENIKLGNKLLLDHNKILLDHNNYLETLIDDMHESLSWKITAPLRRILDNFLKLFKISS